MDPSYGNAAGPSPIGEASFDTEQEKKWRVARIIALVFVYVFPAFFTGPEGGIYFHVPDLLFLIPDSLYELIWWGAVGVQVYFLMNPLQNRPKTFVYGHRNWVAEGLFYFFAVLVALGANPAAFPGLYALPPAAASVIFLIIDVIPILFITVRGSVIIDGQGKKVISLGLIPKVRSFDDVEGLGKLEVRVVNRGYSHFFLVLFFRDGKHWRLKPMDAASIPAEAARVTQATGLPNRPPAGA